MRTALGLWTLLAAGAFSQGPPRGGDTAGAKLRAVWTQARQIYPDALLLSITGKTDASGAVLCDPYSPFQEGWRFTFFSRKKREHLMMAECAGKIAGPVAMEVVREEEGAQLDIKERFIDSDAALQVLAKGGVPLDPVEHKAGGKRPFSLTLHRLEDDRYSTHPLVWNAVVGEDSFLIDAAREENFSPARYGVAASGAGVDSSTAAAARILAKRPARQGAAYTARKDIEGVLEAAKRSFPGARLMAIEGFVDAWGAVPCAGPGDGWFFYFYSPKYKDYKVMLACNGRIGPGSSQYIPVDMSLHQPIDGAGPFVDSDSAVDAAMVQRPTLMNDGMGRKFNRHGELLLLNYRASPFSDQNLWKTTLIWQLKMGTTLFKIDAKNARILDINE